MEMESPPTSARYGGEDLRQRQRMATRSSPKTPSHPSNGYEVLERRKSLSSIRAVSKQREVESNRTDHYSSDSSNAHTMELTLESSTNHSHTQFNSHADMIAIAVSQEDDYDTTAELTHDDAPAPASATHTPGFAPIIATESINIDETTSSIAKRKRRHSTSTLESSKRTRRASLRHCNIGNKMASTPTLDRPNSTDDANGDACYSLTRQLNQTTSDYCVRDSEEKYHDAMLPTSNQRTVEKSTQHSCPSDAPTEMADSPAAMAECAVSPPHDMSQVPLPILSKSSEIGISGHGQDELSRALEKIAAVIIGPLPSEKHVSKRTQKVRVQTSVLESSRQDCALAGNDEEFISTRKKKKAERNRRDTFDLSKKRGLVSSAKRMDLDIIVNDQELNEIHDQRNFVTPRAGSSEAIWKPEDTSVHYGIGNDLVCGVHVEENAAVTRNLESLTCNAIDETMDLLFPLNSRQINKLPCVSARIFTAMNIVYEDKSNFMPLLPLFESLVNAEIVSLQNDAQQDRVCFLNKKVCFSGFDYSSTITAVGAVVGQGGGDLRPSIDALRAVLQHAMKLPKPMYYLDIAIQCLHCMSAADGAHECLSKTMLGYFPTARFQKAITYYLHEMRDFKLYLSSQSNIDAKNEHTGVRNRLNDFIGRSIRYHLRELLNSIPESVMKFDVGECDERWGRAVDDGSISSIMNFSLEKIHEFMTVQPELFEYGVRKTPEVFAREPTTRVFSMSNDELKQMDNSTYESLVMDISEARSFLFGARACSFMVDLLNCPGVKEHIDDAGGWSTVETMASTLYELNLYQGSVNEHFVQLREVQDLLFVSGLDFVSGFLDIQVLELIICPSPLIGTTSFTDARRRR